MAKQDQSSIEEVYLCSVCYIQTHPFLLISDEASVISLHTYKGSAIMVYKVLCVLLFSKQLYADSGRPMNIK